MVFLITQKENHLSPKITNYHFFVLLKLKIIANHNIAAYRKIISVFYFLKTSNFLKKFYKY